MGEVAALSSAFDAEFGKNLAALPPVCPSSEHDAHLNHYRVVQRIAELIAYYASRLPTYASVHRILAFGDTLVKRGEHRLALEACYSYVKQLNIHQQQDVARMDPQTRLSYHVQACYGVATCAAALAMAQDPQVKHPDTLHSFVACLHQLKDTLSLVLPLEQLYWLTLNGTLHIYNISKRLLTAGFVAQMLPFLIFCVKALQSHVIFSTAKYLPWRTQLYVALCYAYADVRAYDMAKQVVQEGLDKIDALIKLQKLDPVPAPPEVQAAYKTAKAMLCALRLKLEVLSAPQGPPPTPLPGEKKAADKKAAVPAMDPALAALQPLIAEVAVTPKAKLTALIEALQVPGRRVVRHEPAQGLLVEVLNSALAEAAPLVARLNELLTATPEDGSAAAVEGATPAEPGLSSMGSGAAGGSGEGGAINPPEAEQLSLLLHRALLCTVYNFESKDAVAELLALGELRLQKGAVGEADEAGVAVFSAVVRVLRALSQLEASPGAGSLKMVSATLLSVCSVAAKAVPDVLTDAALVLYTAAKPLLDGVYSAQDQESGLVIDVLRTLHACWEAVDLDDALLRVTAALKLGLLLEGQAADDEDNASSLYEARDVLTRIRCVASRFRCELSEMVRGAQDEGVRWISASRSQPFDEMAELMSGMPDTDAELACAHVDVLAALYRVELAIGVSEQLSQAQTKQQRLVDSIARREAQSSIFGTRTIKEKRLDEARVMAATTMPPHPPLKERELLQACGKNVYERALVLAAMAPLQGDTHRATQLLTEACDCLVKAQESEDAALAAAQPELGARTSVPLQPRILQRTPTSVTLSNFPFLLKGGKRVAKWAVYSKTYGAGVALILNKTATEYPGTGTMVAPGARVTVEGLRTNDTYVFALAAYDEAGTLLGGLGTSSVELLAGLPLPLYYCWAHVALVACKLKLWAVARRVADVLLPHFIITTTRRPLWEANPMDAQRLARKHVLASTRPLLRAFVQVVYAYTGSVLSSELAALRAPASSGAAARGSGPPLAEMRTPLLEEQVARLVCIKRLLLASHVACLLGDEPLVCEGSARAHHMLAPLVASKARSPMLIKALASVHVALGTLINLVQNSCVGQETNRLAGARVAATVTYHAGLMAWHEEESGAAAYLARLQVEILKAYDPRFTVPGRDPATELLAEAAALQESLLAHPQAAEYAAAVPGGVLAERLKDENDLPAKVLPLLAGPRPMDAWGGALAKEEAVSHPRWVELCVRMLEACVRAGQLTGVQSVADQVVWHIRTGLKMPVVYFAGPKWSLDGAAAALTSVTLAPGDAPPPPQVDGLGPAEKAAAEAAYAEARDDALLQARRRVAAAILLQQRLPVLMARKKVVAEVRQRAPRWAPWVARLNMVMGLMAASEAQKYVTAKVRAKLQGAPAATAEPEAPSRPTSPSKGSGSRPSSPSKGNSRPSSPSKADPKARKDSAKGKGKPVKAEPEAPEPEAPLEPPLVALQYLARAAQAGVRAEAWHEVLNTSRHMWNVSRALMNADTSLMAPTPKLQWEQAPMPPPRTPPESTIAPAGAKETKGGKGAKKEAAKPAAKGAKPAPIKDAPAGPPEIIWPDIPLQKGANRTNTGRALRSALEALLTAIAAIRAGAPLHTGVVPPVRVMPTPAAPPPTDHEAPAGRAVLMRQQTMFSVAATVADGGHSKIPDDASSHFSFGSDLQAELWFQGGPLDMEGLNKYVVMILSALHRMNRFHALLSLGRWWLALSEGVYNELVLPLLMAAAPLVGADTSALTAAMEVVVRDKSTALDALHKVRRTVREKLGEPTPLNQSLGTKVKKKKRAAANPGNRPGAGAATAPSPEGGDDNASLVSVYTFATLESSRSKHSQPDFLRLPAEYEKVIELLKRRNEKGAMILATAELGDVHAHFGNWGGATTSWNDALDALIGPYQVLKSWRKTLDGLSRESIIQRYGVHGCLLGGGVLLGKLARYTYFANAGMRLEAARMGSVLLSALFCAHLGHPQRALEFANYVPVRLWTSANIWADPYRVNMSDLLSGLETLVGVLVDADLHLDALPVISLWEHVAALVTRSHAATVLARIQRVRALVSLGLLPQASKVIIDLMTGTNLPDATIPDANLVLYSEDGAPLVPPAVPPLSGRHAPGTAENKPALDFIAYGPVPAPVEALYGGWVVSQLALVRAAFLMCIGGVPNLWRTVDPATGQQVAGFAPLPTETKGKGGADKAAAAAATTAAASVLPEAVEAGLLDAALVLVGRSKAWSEGKQLDPEPGAGQAGAGDKGGSKAPAKAAAKPTTPKGKKKVEPPAPAPAASAAPQLDPRLLEAQRVEVGVKASLAASEVEALKWRPAAALEHALTALRAMGARGEEGKLNTPLGDNDDTERYALGASLWLRARLQAARCAMALRHTDSCAQLVEAGLKEAAVASDGLAAAQLLAVRALMHESAGSVAPALNAYSEAMDKFAAMRIQDLRAAWTLMGAAALRDRLGLRADSSALVGEAADLLTAWVAQVGLNEARDHPERINIYAAGVTDYAAVLVLAARSASRRKDLSAAVKHLTHALSLLRTHARAMPGQHAVTLLQLGRALRLQVLMAPPGSAPAVDLGAGGVTLSSLAMSVAAAPLLTASNGHLEAALTVASQDGGHARDVMRAALLELASSCVAAATPARAAACLQAAHAAANKRDSLMLSSHKLPPVTVAQLPEWAKEYVVGQEAAFAAANGKPPPTTVPDADIARLVLCHFIALIREAPSLPPGAREKAEAQIAALHPVLRTACPKYLSDTCFAQVPLPPKDNATAPTLAPGAVVTQWYQQDGCWQVHASFVGSGSLPKPAIDTSDVLALQPVESFASLVYVVVTAEGETRAGDVAFPVAAVRNMARRVKELRYRLESPRGATDLWGYDAPSEGELAALRAGIERFLSKRRVSDDGAAPSMTVTATDYTPEVPSLTPSPIPPMSPAPQPPSRAGSPAKAVKGAGAGAGAAPGTPATPQSVSLPPTDLTFLTRLEALLAVTNGMDLNDVGFAEWLAQTLPHD